MEEGIGRSAADTVVDIAVGTADQTAAGIVDRTEMEPLENRAVVQETHQEAGIVPVRETHEVEKILLASEIVLSDRDIQ